MTNQVSIKQLPQITEINSDDLLLIQKPDSTNTLKFRDLIIGLDNTTFSNTIIQNSTDVSSVSGFSVPLSTAGPHINPNFDTTSQRAWTNLSATHILPIVFNDGSGNTYALLASSITPSY